MRHLSNAKSFILVATAWFTDQTLFHKLLDKVKEGVQVWVLIHDDEINTSSGIDYTQLNSPWSEVNLIADEKKMMHHKFCVIDGFTVLNGSYNWTNQAAYNHESLTVTTGDISLAAEFTTQFFRILKTYETKQVLSNDSDSLPEKTTFETRKERQERRRNNSRSILEKIQERRRIVALKQSQSAENKSDDNKKENP